MTELSDTERWHAEALRDARKIARARRNPAGLLWRAHLAWILISQPFGWRAVCAWDYARSLWEQTVIERDGWWDGVMPAPRDALDADRQYWED